MKRLTSFMILLASTVWITMHAATTKIYVDGIHGRIRMTEPFIHRSVLSKSYRKGYLQPIRITTLWCIYVMVCMS